eukprot:g53012.t1
MSMDFNRVYAWIKEQWGPARQKLVKPIRKGDFAKCAFCTELASEHHSGFKTKTAATEWRTRNRIHNKIHRANRRGSMRLAVEGVDGLQRQRPLAWQYQAGNSENGFLPRVRVKTWGDAQMHWHGVNDDPDGEDILPYTKEPDRPAKLPHVDWATPKIVKDVQFLANKKRRRSDAEEPLENEEISSSSESSDDEPLVPLQNQPHSAARVRVRRTFASVFACSDEEREAQGLREEGCRSDLSESSSEGWQPPNAFGD